MYTYKLVNLIGIEPREPESKIEQHHMDLAAALQKWYESCFYYFTNNCMQQSNTSNLVLGGGSAYNGTANGKIQKHAPVGNLWIPFAPSDAGSAIGACLYHWHNTLGSPKVNGGDNQSPYLGPEWTNQQFTDIILKEKVTNKAMFYDDTKMLCQNVAKLINDGAVVGWFQGRTEFGARALGNRSILANPHLPDVRDRINRVVKKRELFRPFAPSVLAERVSSIFDITAFSPYMLVACNVKEVWREKIPAVVHIDGTGRLQTVTSKSNTRFYNLIKSFFTQTGIPMVLNTSFNENEPIVFKPEHALNCFLRTKMDLLVLQNYIIKR
jgi:carbamoyltransferase